MSGYVPVNKRFPNKIRKRKNKNEFEFTNKCDECGKVFVITHARNESEAIKARSLPGSNKRETCNMYGRWLYFCDADCMSKYEGRNKVSA